jgi:hypothetical protein
MASELNKMCPMVIDSETRLDNAITFPPKIFQYNYTIVNLEREEIDTLELKNFFEQMSINNMRTNPDMYAFRDNKVTLKHSYKDKVGNHLFTVTVTPEQYE